MPIHIEDIEISRPHFLGGETWKIKRLNALTVLLGRNGSGKSQLLRAIRSSEPGKRHYIVPERTGDISFSANLITEVMSPTSRMNRSQQNFSSEYRQEVITRIQGYYTRRGTKNRSELENDPDELLRLMAFLLPDFQIAVKPENPFYGLTRVRDGQSVTSVSSLSSGESQLLALGL